MKNIKTIFLIDDDKLANHLTEKIIRHILSTATIQKFEKPRFALIALEQLAETNMDQFPEMIFLDINMPILTGWDFLKEYEKLPRAALAKCKLYMLSLTISEEDFTMAKNYKCISGVLTKPLNFEKVFEAIV